MRGSWLAVIGSLTTNVNWWCRYNNNRSNALNAGATLSTKRPADTDLEEPPAKVSRWEEANLSADLLNNVGRWVQDRLAATVGIKVTAILDRFKRGGNGLRVHDVLGAATSLKAEAKKRCANIATLLQQMNEPGIDGARLKMLRKEVSDAAQSWCYSMHNLHKRHTALANKFKLLLPELASKCKAAVKEMAETERTRRDGVVPSEFDGCRRELHGMMLDMGYTFAASMLTNYMQDIIVNEIDCSLAWSSVMLEN
jgi:hypothetical protein